MVGEEGCRAGKEVVTGCAVAGTGRVRFSDDSSDIGRVQPDEPAKVRSIRKQRKVKIFIGEILSDTGINPFFNIFW